MPFASLSTPLRRLHLTYTAEGVRIAVDTATGLRLRSASVVVRRATADLLWSADLDGGSHATLDIAGAGLAEALEALWPEHQAGLAPVAPGAPVRPIIADLVLGIESDRELPGIRVGLHGYSGLSVGDAGSQASRPLPGSHGRLTAYARRSGNVSFVHGPDQPAPQTRGSIRFVRRHARAWDLFGEVESHSFALAGGVLTLVGRRSGERVDVPTVVTGTPDRDEVVGNRRLRFTATLDQGSLLGLFPRPEFLDAHFQAAMDGYASPIDVRVRRLAPVGRLVMPESVFSDGTHAGELRAYRTFKAGALAFEFRPLDPAAVAVARSPWRTGKRLRWSTRGRPVWVVGERPETAQDTGIALYEHLRERHPEIDARYVITSDSPDLPRLARDPGVLLFGSREHVESCLAARRILGSHHTEYLLPLRGGRFQRNVPARRVFLQHGVMGTKNMVANYGYDAPGFRAESFIVSSERERRMIEDDFGWPSERVFVTGLARHDRLLAPHPPPQRRLLVMPTWRDWLKSRDDVRQSEFFARWNAFLTDPAFSGFLEDHDLVADLYLHANMQPHADLFDLSAVTVVRHGEMAIQDLLLRSIALVTDYTSAAIDFSFLDRPVVYYQFDRGRFLGRRPSHFDLEGELPGEIVATGAELVEVLQQAAERGFAPHPEAVRKSRALLGHRDTGARERIVAAARQTPRRRLVPPGARDATRSLRRLWRRTRNRRRVVAVRTLVNGPIRKAIYRVARQLPRADVAVFESNLGADLGDSPGAIHRAMRQAGIPLRTAWVVRPGVQAPEGSAALRRLSWRYFWTVGRARVWVDNQNMPAWMRRPDATYYLQTWHGTPLKRMLHDLEVVIGRDDGYVARVDRMIQEWSVLLSPSPWATERFRSAFRYDGEVLEVGYPRNDVLADSTAEDRAERVRRGLGLHRSKKVLVYAPTFRDDQRSGTRFTFALPIDLPALVAAVGQEYEIVVRLHPVVRGRTRLPWGVHRAGAGYQMEDLLAVADVLVTDYSSVMFDYSVLDRPMLFFVPDLERYRDTLRGFYFDFENEAPGPLLRTTAELAEALTSPDALESARAAVRPFRERFCPDDDGLAGRRVVEAMVERGVFPAPAHASPVTPGPAAGRSPSPRGTGEPEPTLAAPTAPTAPTGPQPR